MCVFHFNDVKQSIILLSLEVYLSVQRNNIKLILALLSTMCNEHKHSCSTHALADYRWFLMWWVQIFSSFHLKHSRSSTYTNKNDVYIKVWHVTTKKTLRMQQQLIDFPIFHQAHTAKTLCACQINSTACDNTKWWIFCAKIEETQLRWILNESNNTHNSDFCIFYLICGDFKRLLVNSKLFSLNFTIFTQSNLLN